MTVFIYKPGVPDVEPSEAIKKARAIYAKVWEKWWGSEPITITSTTDGKHGEHSKHYDKPHNAEDFRFPMQFKQWLTELRTELGKDYDVVVEGNHVHLEYDKKA